MIEKFIALLTDRLSDRLWISGASTKVMLELRLCLR